MGSLRGGFPSGGVPENCIGCAVLLAPGADQLVPFQYCQVEVFATEPIGARATCKLPLFDEYMYASPPTRNAVLPYGRSALVGGSREDTLSRLRDESEKVAMRVPSTATGPLARLTSSRNTYKRFAATFTTAEAGQYARPDGGPIHAERASGAPPNRGLKHRPVWITALFDTRWSFGVITPEDVTLPMKVSPKSQSVRDGERRTGTAPSADAHSVYVLRRLSNAAL
jgi:hypothetical protein